MKRKLFLFSAMFATTAVAFPSFVFCDLSGSVRNSPLDADDLKLVLASETFSTRTVLPMKNYDLLTEGDAVELFETPLGPHPICFSTNQIVRMFESGTRPDELRHILECPACGDLLRRSSRLARMLESAAPTQKTSFGQTLKELLVPDQASETRADVAVVLGLADPVVEVTDPNTALSVTVSVLPCVDTTATSKLVISSLLLGGALASASASVEPMECGSERVCEVTFEGSKLSKAVKKRLAEHAKVTDQISVSGVLKGKQDRTFSGKARVEFVHAQTA